jgi:hypothetical protein
MFYSMFRFERKIFWMISLCAVSTLPMRAQTVAIPTVQNVSAPERVAILDLSAELAPAQSRAVAAALTKVCLEASNWEVAPESSLSAYLKRQRHFSIFAAEKAQELCKNLGLNYLIVSTFESVAPAAKSAEPNSIGALQVTLRWLDGGTGQITKTSIRECTGDLKAPESLPLRDLFQALLESPELILTVDGAPTEAPPVMVWPPEVRAPAMDSAATNNMTATTRLYHSRHGRRWLWYFTGAAVLGSGSAVLLLRKAPNPAPAAKTLLPEPPDPPK